FGNSANNANGKAKATPKPVIPTVSCVAPPSLDNEPANSEPNIGPVQENETMAKVKAIKNIPIIPPAPEALSILFPQECGSVSSKYPKKEKAKTTTMIKKITGNQTLVDILLRISGAIESKKCNGTLSAIYIPTIKTP